MTAMTREDTFTDSDLSAAGNGTAQRNGFVVDAAGTDAAVSQYSVDDVEEVTVDAAPESPQEPPIKIVKGNPSDTEIAALVAVFIAASGSGAAAAGSGLPPESWGAPRRMHRQATPFSPYSYPNVAYYG